MQRQFHAVIWIDHREARILQVRKEQVEKQVIHSKNAARQIHHKANSIGSGHSSEDHDFYRDIVNALADAVAILITGPAGEKTSLVKFIQMHAPKLASLIVGVEAVDHPSDGVLLAHAKNVFHAKDRMSPLKL